MKVFGPALILFVFSCGLHLCLGAQTLSPLQVWNAIWRFDPDSLDHFIIMTQRLPRALIAVYTGMVMAMGGAVLQALSHNPLASPQLLGINAGAVLFTVIGAFYMGLSSIWLGYFALTGGVVGFALCVSVAQMAGLGSSMKGLSLILSGAILSMLLLGIANAILLSEPNVRSGMLSWISGDISHVYSERLYQLYWIGLLGAATLLVLSKPLTLISLGSQKAAAAGVAVKPVTWAALAAVIFGASSAVAICGPIGFIGLAVPHMVRPLTGNILSRSLPVNAFCGAVLCLWADLAARFAFRPIELQTGIMMDFLGGAVFVWIVRKHYLRPSHRKKTA